MLTLYLAAALLAQSPDPTPSKTTDPPAELRPLDEILDDLAAAREARIEAARRDLAAVPDRSDWKALSPAAREKLERPARERLRAAEADRRLTWPTTRNPEQTKPGDVFELTPTAAKARLNNDWRLETTIDQTTATAWKHTNRDPKLSGPAGTLPRLIIEGLTPAAAKAPRNSELILDGLWYRRPDLTLDGETLPRIARYPHAAEARKRWPAKITPPKK